MNERRAPIQPGGLRGQRVHYVLKTIGSGRIARLELSRRPCFSLQRYISLGRGLNHCRYRFDRRRQDEAKESLEAIRLTAERKPDVVVFLSHSRRENVPPPAKILAVRALESDGPPCAGGSVHRFLVLCRVQAAGIVGQALDSAHHDQDNQNQ